MKKKKEPAKKGQELYSDLYGMVEEAKNNSSTWAEKANNYYRLRMRQKKTKTFPFPGCSNLRLPTIETVMRKTKAALMALYTNVKPRVMVIPQTDSDMGKAGKIEQFLDWLAETKIRMMPKLAIITDNMLQHGISLAKVIWRMEDVKTTENISIDDFEVQEVTALFDSSVPEEKLLEILARKFNVDISETVVDENIEELKRVISEFRNGKTKVKMSLKDELYNAPDVVPCDPTYVYVPTDAGINVQELRFIAHEYFEPYNVLQYKAENDIIDKDGIDDIDYYKGVNIQDQKNVNFTKDLREGIDRINNPSKMVKVIDLYTYYDLDDDGTEEKCHFLLAPDFSVVLKKQKLEKDSQKWPFIRFCTEITDNRWFSPRGFPEHLEDLSKEIDAQHNQKIDNQTIRNAPLFVFRSGIINPRLVKFIPGQGIPVPGTTPLDDAIKVMDNNNSNVDFSYEREEMILKGIIQEYIGQVDYSLQSMINKRQPRTLGEVEMQSQAANTVFSLDASFYAEALGEIFSHILDLCQQYMPERIFAQVVGTDGITPLHITRDEIQGKYHTFCRGNDITSNPQLRLQKAILRIQILLNPEAVQMGVVTPMNAFNILKYYLQYDNELAWKEMITQPKPPPPLVAPETQVKFNELTDGEQAQILASRGIKPDIQGRSMKSKAITDDKTADRRTEEIKSLTDIAKLFGDKKDAKKEKGKS